MGKNELERRSLFTAGLNNFISSHRLFILDGRLLKTLIPE
jgi:hypothetical protein